MEKPYLRLCADIDESHPYPFEDVRRAAIVGAEDAAFLIGRYGDLLRPYATEHFRRLRFPYSLVEVDGLKSSGRINIAIWLTKPDIDTVVPRDYARALSNISIIELLRKVEEWREVEEHVVDAEKIATAKAFSRSLGREDPLLMELVYGSEVDDGFRTQTSILPPYTNFPPSVWHFYGGSAPPEWFAEMDRQFRGSPDRFSDAIDIFLRRVQTDARDG